MYSVASDRECFHEWSVPPWWRGEVVAVAASPGRSFGTSHGRRRSWSGRGDGVAIRRRPCVAVSTAARRSAMACAIASSWSASRRLRTRRSRSSRHGVDLARASRAGSASAGRATMRRSSGTRIRSMSRAPPSGRSDRWRWRTTRPGCRRGWLIGISPFRCSMYRMWSCAMLMPAGAAARSTAHRARVIVARKSAMMRSVGVRLGGRSGRSPGESIVRVT